MGSVLELLKALGIEKEKVIAAVGALVVTVLFVLGGFLLFAAMIEAIGGSLT